MKLKRILSLLLAIVMVASLCACSSANKYVAIFNGKEVSVSSYRYMLFNTYNAFSTYIDNPSSPVREWTIGGVDAVETISNYTRLSLLSYIGVTTLCEKYGITFDKEKHADDVAEANEFWNTNKDTLEGFGVSESAFRTVAYSSYMSNDLQLLLYGEGGEYEVKDQEILEYFNTNYRRILEFDCPLDGFDTDKILEIKDVFDEYEKRINNGEDMQDIVYEEYARQNDTNKTSMRASLGERYGETFVEKEASTYPPEFVEEIFACTDSDAHQFNYLDQYFVMYKVLDLMGDGSEYEESKEDLISVMTSERFSALITEKLEDVDYKINEEALAKHNLATLFGQ